VVRKQRLLVRTIIAAQGKALSYGVVLALVGIIVAASANPCQAGDRVALVIGNSNYEGNLALRNPANDADAVETALKALGFSVATKKDLDLSQMEEALVDFRRKLTKGSLGLFYYAGHGTQVGGLNYLIPIGARLREEFEVKRKCLEVGQVLDAMAESESNLKVLVLDCCRDNPLKRGWSRNSATQGLAGISNVPNGTIIAFSTAPNATADDGSGKNSPYAEQLVSVLQSRPSEGLELSEVFREASRAVKRQTGQVPWMSLEASLEKYYLWNNTASKPSSGPMPPSAIGSSSTPTTPPREVSVSLTVHRGEEDGPPVEGADVELVYTASDHAAPLTIGRGRTDAEGKTRIDTALTTAQQHGGTFAAVISSDGVHKDWPLPEFPVTLAWNLWLPNRPPRPKTPEQPHDRTITNSIGMKMVLIPAGEFQMGSSADEIKSWNDWFKQQEDLKSVNIDREGPQHRVRITRPFYFGAHTVTVGQFRKFAVDSGHDAGTNIVDKDKSWRNAFPDQTDQHPVVNVSWDDAVAFCQWLSRKEGKTYRLPTEAEWEYACRAGSTTRYCFGNDEEEKELGNYAWYTKTSDSATHPVGEKRANAFGLYDMYGNVWQWCADWYDKDYYGASPADDPPGPSTGSSRVDRGGSWSDSAWFCRSADRNFIEPGDRDISLGFRVARSAE
jgi:formylglycine-generating enzyme required for sulfatase activity